MEMGNYLHSILIAHAQRKLLSVQYKKGNMIHPTILPDNASLLPSICLPERKKYQKE